MTTLVRWSASAACAAFVGVAPALARQAARPEPTSRAAELRQQREDKSTQLQPYKPSRAERLMLTLENNRTWERFLNPPEGIYPRIGTVTPGSGLAFGPAARWAGLFGERADVSAFAAVSFKKYWQLDARLTFPRLADGNAFADAYVQRYDYPLEPFFGIGPESRRADDTTFKLDNHIVGGSAGWRLGPWLSVGGRVEHLAPSIDRGAGRPMQDRFTDADAPGLIEQPAFGRYEAFAALNTRTPRANPRRGSFLGVRYQRYDDRTLDRYNFERTEVDAQQYVGWLNDRRVIALRGFVSTSSAEPGQRVPFYLLRTLGGPDDLRGFRRFRFRDQHLILVQAEYRFEVFTAMDGVVFYDAGKVAARRDDLDLRRLETDWGAGVRFGTNNGVFLRIEGAFGSRDGRHLVLRFGNVF